MPYMGVPLKSIITLWEELLLKNIPEQKAIVEYDGKTTTVYFKQMKGVTYIVDIIISSSIDVVIPP